jgi:phosphoglycolate phosphatase
MKPTVQKIELVIFDLDGTLADTVPQIALSVKRALERNNLPFPGVDRIRGFVGNGADRLIQRSITNRFDATESDIEPELFQKVRRDYFEIYMDEISSNFSLFPGVRETLKDLKKHGIKLAIATNKPDIYIKPWLKAAELESIFDVTVGGGILATKKPDPEILFQICRKLSVDCSNALMVGDSSNDVLAARNAGMRSVGLTYGYNYSKPIASFNPSYVLDDFSKIIEIVLG